MKLITSMAAWSSGPTRWREDRGPDARDLALAVVSVCDNNVRMFKKIVYRG